MKKNSVHILIFIAITPFIVVALFTVGKLASQKNYFQSKQQTTLVAPEYNSRLETSDSKWQKGKTYGVNLSLVNKDYIPTAVTIHIKVDPKILKIDDIKEGNLWSQVNILQKKIDTSNGEVTLSMGQAFAAKLTGNTTIANLRLTPLSSVGSTSISLSSDSVSAKMKNDSLIPLKSVSLTISVED